VIPSTLLLRGGTDDAPSKSVATNSNQRGLQLRVKNSYSICIRSTDFGGLHTDKTFPITVTNANGPPPILCSRIAVSPRINRLARWLGTCPPLTRDTGDTSTYSFCGGTDDASFWFSGNRLQTTAVSTNEVKNSYSVASRLHRQWQPALDKTFRMRSRTPTETPTNSTLSNSNIAENQPVGSPVGNMSTIDPDAGDTFTYSFCGGTDDASFRFHAETSCRRMRCSTMK